MRFHTHDHTPKVQMPKHIKILFGICAVLLYGMFAMAALSCFYNEQSILGGFVIIALVIVLTLLVFIPFRDMSRAYIQINGEEIQVVDYYLGIPKIKNYTFSHITSAEIALAYSHRVKGYRIHTGGTQYIILRHGKQYLFKIIYFPETGQLFKQYLQDSV